MSTDAVLTTDHLADLLSLSAEAGWNQTAADWAVFIDHGTLFGHLLDGRVVATAAAIPFGPAFGWVSMVLTTKAHRNQGHARRLTALATATLRDTGRTAFLDATPAGAEVYTRLGFVPVCGMQRWQGQGGGAPATQQAANLALDLPAFGADRRFLLTNILGRPSTKSFADTDAYALLRDGAIASQLGPVVGGPTTAAPLVQAAISAASGRVFIDVLEAGYGLLDLLEAAGFTQQRPFTRMALGDPHLPGDPARLLVAASPEFG